MSELLDYLFRSALLKFQTVIHHLAPCWTSPWLSLWSRTCSAQLQPSCCSGTGSVTPRAPLGESPRTIWRAWFSVTSCSYRGWVGWRCFASFLFFCLLISHCRESVETLAVAGLSAASLALACAGKLRHRRSMVLDTLWRAPVFMKCLLCLCRHSVSWWDGEPSSVHRAEEWTLQTRKHSSGQSLFQRIEIQSPQHRHWEKVKSPQRRE